MENNEPDKQKVVERTLVSVNRLNFINDKKKSRMSRISVSP